MHAMSDPTTLAGMLPFESIGLYEPPKQRFIFKMPRVVPDQKGKFESDDLFKRLSRETDVRYTGYRDRPQEERQVRFTSGCREGHTEIAFTTTGTNLQLVFDHSYRGCDFQKETGKVHILSRFIMNGVCVQWRGWIDLEKLDGTGCLELDEERAAIEAASLRDQMERYNQRLRDFEDKRYREHGDELRHHHAQRCHAPRQPPHAAHPPHPAHPAHPAHPQPAHPVHIKSHSQGALIS